MKMAGESANEPKVSGGGLSKIFNGDTMRGRANVAKATYGVIALVIAYNMLKPKKN